MFGKILNFKFTSVSEAKLAASFCSEKFGSKITEYKIVGLNIFIGQTGDLNVSIKATGGTSLFTAKQVKEDYEPINSAKTKKQIKK